ncbi:DDE_Tnp_1_7 domain-containing protein [Nephila pilipes]|uniref:DDE_Tnp_1_7 domain-containing protein n=1 Tax=Nephila pilipes TaxID=299642 RepID=A0A8X6MM08_NEPPI|nr:DDE_Tnp_1_7 domain-containing protein [Nephila pilipes]
MAQKRILTQDEIDRYMNNLYELNELSEDGLEYSDDDDVDFLPDCVSPNEDSDSDCENSVGSQNTIQNIKKSDDYNKLNRNISAREPFINLTFKNNKTLPKNILWKNQNISLNEEVIKFYGDDTLRREIMDFDTPYQFFKYLWTDKIINNIYDESIRYAIQKNPSKPLTISKNEINQYLGICIYASLVHLPNYRAYWSEELGFDQIKETMPLKKFETIRQYLHFIDNDKHLPRDHPNHDRLHKIRPIYDELNKNFAKVPLERHLSIDEQICSTKVRHYMKQYLPMKPHKWGFKFFVLCGILGFAYKLELYSDQENNEKYRQKGEPGLGASANVVIRLARIISRNKNYTLYFVNYYTSIPLLAYLSKEEICSLGTINKNRIPISKISTEKVFNQMERGHSMEFFGNNNDVEISVTAWKDNKTVIMASTFAGEKQLGKVMRYDKKIKNREEITSCH